MNKRLLSILCCPVSHKRLSLMKKQDLARLNSLIEAGSLCNVEGETVRRPLKAALVTDDGKRAYPIEDDKPVLLADRAIGMEQAA